jgi:RHS repeat-associated protein
LIAEHETAARSYYSADDRLMVHQVTRDSIDHSGALPDTADSWGAYEEYWYDALGRRVLKRSQQSAPICEHEDRCYSSIERFVWDGDQILWELRQGGSGDTKNPSGSPYTGQTGNVGYVHAGGIDAPLGMTRNGSAIVLHQNWRGLYVAATDSAGDDVGTDIPWPGVSWSVTRSLLDPRETHTWLGSLPIGLQDATGLNYQRNRYYDPESGQFTQQDPIGIAGGINLYGYANGDPINFSDPFGLDPCWTIECIFRGISRHILGSIGTSPEQLEADVEEALTGPCTVATLSAGLTMISDATTVAGVGAAVRTGALAFGAGGVATNLARTEVVRDLAPAAIRESSELVGEGLEQGARAALGGVGSSATLNTMSEATGTATSVGDWVPGIASRNAVGRAQQACAR